jgi:hypothetical protein
MKIYWKSETHVQFVLTVLLNPYHENLLKVRNTCTICTNSVIKPLPWKFTQSWRNMYKCTMKIYTKLEKHVQMYHENLHKVGETCTNVLSVVNLTVHWLYLVYTSDQTTLMLTVAWKTVTNCNKIFKSIQQ